MNAKRLATRFFAGLTVVALMTGLLAPHAAAASMNPNNIIDDYTFSNTGTMNAGDINNFLNSFSGSCISTNHGFSAPDPTGYSPSGGFTYGGNASAGQVIYDAAQAYGLNPQVLIATLQKEQSLVTGSAGCDVHQYAAAVGYGCPDSGGGYSYSNVDLYTVNGNTVTSVNNTCVNSDAKVGFSQQIIRAAWLLKFGQQRSEGDVGWEVVKGSWINTDDPQSCYGGPMTQGNFQRCPSGATTYYDGYTTIDGSSVHMDNGATAALYWYTPHFSGNQNFFNLFTGWFGSTISNRCISSNNDLPIADVLFNKIARNRSRADLVLYTGTQSDCLESHIWQSGFTSWQQHIASNLPTINPSQGTVMFADLNGSGTDYPVVVDQFNTGSGKIEFHVWDPSMHTWIVHAISNLPDNQTGVAIDFADLDGSGVDEPIAISYANSGSGMVEFHVWNNGLQSWKEHIISNLPDIDPSNMLIRFADLDGSGRDVPVVIGTNNTATGMVEFHVWNPGMQSWQEHVVSNLPTGNMANGTIWFADVNGTGRDQAVFVAKQHTGSGMVEFHVWNPGMQSWQEHVVSNQTIL